MKTLDIDYIIFYYLIQKHILVDGEVEKVDLVQKRVEVIRSRITVSASADDSKSNAAWYKCITHCISFEVGTRPVDLPQVGQ